MTSITSTDRFIPTTDAMRRMLLIASLLVFSIGFSLFVLSHQTETYFAWSIKSPITAAFLGACYWASGVLELAASRERYWDNARCTVPAVWIFTALTLVITFLHLDKFHFGASQWITLVGTWVWLAVYLFVPIILGYLWFRQRQQTGEALPTTRRLPRRLRLLLWLWAIPMLLFGLILLVIPQASLSLWPWELTPLTARATGAWLLGWATLMGYSAWENELRRARSTFYSLSALSILQGVVIYRYSEMIKWSSPGAWIWMLFLLCCAFLGFTGILEQYQDGPADPPIPDRNPIHRNQHAG